MTMHYRDDIKSSQAHKVGYDATKRLLEVHFTSGGVYEYDGVSPADYDALMRAPSFGKHFHAHIKGGGFNFRRIDQGDAA